MSPILSTSSLPAVLTRRSTEHAPGSPFAGSAAAVGLIRQFAKFLLVGVGNTLLSLAVYSGLLGAGLHYGAAGAIAFAAGAVNGYVLNRRWTFAAPDSTRARARYLVVQLAGLGATDALLWLFVSGAGVGRIGAYLATVPIVTVATFVANRDWAFRARSAREPGGAVQAFPAASAQEIGSPRVSAAPVDRRAPSALTVDVVVPVYNEARDLGPSIRRLHAYLRDEFPFGFRITIADNASTDATWELARRLSGELPGVRALHLDEKGRGRALRAAWSASDAAVLAYTDVDLSTDLAALLPLVAPLLSGHSDLAIGSRLSGSARVTRGRKRELISRSYNLILRTVLRVRFSDAQCGFKAIRADCAGLLLPLVEDTGWFFDTELLVLAERAGLRIHEVPVDWVDDPDSRVDVLGTAVDDLRGIVRLVRTLALRRLPLRELHAELERRRLAVLVPSLRLLPDADARERNLSDHHAA